MIATHGVHLERKHTVFRSKIFIHKKTRRRKWNDSCQPSLGIHALRTYLRVRERHCVKKCVICQMLLWWRALSVCLSVCLSVSWCCHFVYAREGYCKQEQHAVICTRLKPLQIWVTYVPTCIWVLFTPSCTSNSTLCYLRRECNLLCLKVVMAHSMIMSSYVYLAQFKLHEEWCARNCFQ